jgi:hypothetical protein
MIKGAEWLWLSDQPGLLSTSTPNMIGEKRGNSERSEAKEYNPFSLVDSSILV